MAGHFGDWDAAIFSLAKWSRPVALMLGLFVLAILPMLGLVPFRFQEISTTADHYVYFPSAFLAVALALVWQKVPRIPQTAILIWLAVLAGYSALHLKVWKDMDSLAGAELKYNPTSSSFLAALGDHKVSKGDLTGAIEDYRRAVKIAPQVVGPRNNLAGILYLSGQHEDGIRELESLAEEKGVPSFVLNNFGYMLIDSGKASRAISYLERSIRESDNGEAHLNLSLAYRSLGQSQQAEKELTTALTIDPVGVKARMEQLGKVKWAAP